MIDDLRKLSEAMVANPVNLSDRIWQALISADRKGFERGCGAGKEIERLQQDRELLLVAAKCMVKLADANMTISPNAFAISDLRKAIAFVEEAATLESK